MWKVASVVGLAGVALWAGIRAWSPVHNVGRVDASAPASAPSPEEEREAAAIGELALAGRNAEAKTRAEQFLVALPERARWPIRVRLSAKR